MAPRLHHSTPLLKLLHWLPISEHIKYKVACTCFHAINGSSPIFLSDFLHIYTPSLRFCSASDAAYSKSNNLNARLTAFTLSLTLDPMFWIHSHKTPGNAQLLHLFRQNWKLSFFHSTSVSVNFISHLNQNLCVCVCVNTNVCVCMFVCVHVCVY